MRLPPFLFLLLAGAAAVSFVRAESWVGTVTEDYSGDAVAFASVRVWQNGAHAVLVDLETDGAGHFALPVLTGSNYRMEVAKPNYVTTTVAFENDPHSAATRPMTIPLVRCGAVTGQVTGASGEPVPGASVYLVRMPSNEHGGKATPLRSPGHFSTVDDEGRFRLHGIGPGQYRVAVSYGQSTMAVGSSGNARVREGVGSGTIFYPAGAEPKVFTVSGGEEFSGVDFVIAPGTLATVKGKVEAPSSTNPNETFWLTLVSKNQPGVSTATASTERDRSFRFDGVPAGSYALLISGPSAARSSWGGIPGKEPLFGRTAVEVGGTDVENLTVVPSPGVSAGFVLRARDSEAASVCPKTASASLVPLEDWGSALERSFDLNLDRKTMIDHLAPGLYSVRIDLPGDQCFGVGAVQVNLSRAQDQPVALEMVAPAKLEGRLTGAAQTGNFSVLLVDSESADAVKAVRQAIPDKDFAFVFDGLRPGLYRIGARRLGETVARRAKMMDIDIKGGQRNTIELAVPAAEATR